MIHHIFQRIIYSTVSIIVLFAIFMVINFLGVAFTGFIPTLFMIFSIPICMLYVWLYKQGLISVLKNQSVYLSTHLWLAIACVGFIFLTKDIYIYIYPTDMEKMTIFEFTFSVTLLITVPLFLTISPLSFIVAHDEKFAKTWFFTLCFIFSIIFIAAPFLWIPMIIYYPLMRKYTSKVKKRLQKNN